MRGELRRAVVAVSEKSTFFCEVAAPSSCLSGDGKRGNGAVSGRLVLADLALDSGGSDSSSNRQRAPGVSPGRSGELLLATDPVSDHAKVALQPTSAGAVAEMSPASASCGPWRSMSVIKSAMSSIS